MEYKLIVAVSGFPSLYDTNSATYRDLSLRGEAWRQISEMVGVPECECRRKWKTLRDQHRRERQRERARRRGGALCSFRPWRFSSILAFLNPFIDSRASGANGWALEAPPRPPPPGAGGGLQHHQPQPRGRLRLRRGGRHHHLVLAAGPGPPEACGELEPRPLWPRPLWPRPLWPRPLWRPAENRAA
ncbi:uncharacterized protein ACNS7B_002490 [Menidia menidia]